MPKIFEFLNIYSIFAANSTRILAYYYRLEYRRLIRTSKDRIYVRTHRRQILVLVDNNYYRIVYFLAFAPQIQLE